MIPSASIRKRTIFRLCLYCSDWIIEWISQLSTSASSSFLEFTNFHVSTVGLLCIRFLWQVHGFLCANGTQAKYITTKKVAATFHLFIYKTFSMWNMHGERKTLLTELTFTNYVVDSLSVNEYFGWYESNRSNEKTTKILEKVSQ